MTAPDHMQVLSLRYKIGDKIPEEEWAQYNLYRESRLARRGENV